MTAATLRRPAPGALTILKKGGAPLRPNATHGVPLSCYLQDEEIVLMLLG